MHKLRFIPVNTGSNNTHVTIAFLESRRHFYSSFSMLAIRPDEDSVSFNVLVGDNVNVNVRVSIRIKNRLTTGLITSL